MYDTEQLHRTDRTPVPRQRPDPPREPLAEFMARSGSRVLDVTPGVRHGTRRLLLGDPATSRVTHAVAVCPGAAPGALETEQTMLGRVRPLLPTALSATLAQVRGRVDVDRDQAGLVMTAVPGLRRQPSADVPPASGSWLDAVGSWLSAVWRETGTGRVPVSLGADAHRLLASRVHVATRLGPTLAEVAQARAVLAPYEVPVVPTHLCMCPRHVFADHGSVTGVDDWGRGVLRGDPLREIGRLVVLVAGHRLPEVVSGRTARAHLLRDVLVAGMAAVGVPPQLWRDVLVLAGLDVAVEAWERGEVAELATLAVAVRALPRRRPTRRAVQP